MYQITIAYNKYLCNYCDLIEILTALQKMRKLEADGGTTGIAYSVEEAGNLEDLKYKKIVELQKESEQRARWWYEESQKNRELEARIKELESNDEIPSKELP